MLADQHAGNRAQRVERLRKVQAPRRAIGRTEDGHQRVGRGFQECQAAGDHEQRQQEQPVGVHLRSRIEQEGAAGVQQQAQHHRGLVAVAAHEHRRRHGKHEIAHVERALHQPGLQIGQLERLLELLDQDVVEVVGHAPQKEQADNQQQGNHGGARQVAARRRGNVTVMHATVPLPRLWRLRCNRASVLRRPAPCKYKIFVYICTDTRHLTPPRVACTLARRTLPGPANG